MKTSTVCKSVAIAALTAGGLLAHAAEALDGPPPGWSGPPPGWSGGVLGGAARLPDFEGSRTSRTQPVLGFAITYRTQTLGSVEMGSRGLNWTFVQRPDVDLGVGLSLDPGRLDNGERKLTAALFEELRECDAVIIPSNPHDPRKAVKSPNRFTEALWAGRFVLAHPLPAYEALAAYGWVGEDLGEGLTWLLDHGADAVERIRQGQKWVAQHASLQAVGAAWAAAVAAA